ncbi:MAG: helix-turn-helix transcriptional regulator [Lachnospiraceae bacterium]|nr:helix-turn-helix transcriptional regulator [Lachnospiraceae bacterium]
MTQGERVKEIRKELDLTLEKFGEKLGVKRNTMSAIETGRNSITDQMAKSICREFNVNEEWLRSGNGPVFIEQTRDEQIASFIGGIQSIGDDSFKKRLISLLSEMTEDEWNLLEKMVIRLSNEKD